jgi:TrmH family RNA methyltransferase
MVGADRHEERRAAYFARLPAPRADRAKYTRPLSTKAELKHVRSLQQKKYREEHGLFLVQGPKLVEELLRSGLPAEAIYATPEARTRLRIPHAIELPAHEMERLGTLESGNEVVAVVPVRPQGAFAPLAMDELVLALDGIADPGNLGTVLRIADWFGIGRVLCSAGSVDVHNPKCVQASMGAIFRVQVHYGDLAALLGHQGRAGATTYLASMEGRSVFDVRLRRPAVLVLGSESHGVSDAVRAVQSELVAVPRFGAAESLNVAMAASALCMEFARQRTV